jgi:hypothetical protein
MLTAPLLRLTVWDVASQIDLVSTEARLVSNVIRWFQLDEPLPVEEDKEYLVTFTSNDWYYFIHSPRMPVYPQTVGQIEIVNSRHGVAHAQPPTSFDFATAIIDDYITQGVDILFIPDIEENEAGRGFQ